MDSDVFLQVTGVSSHGDSAELHGYSRFSVIGESYPAIVPCDNGTVQGILYDDLSDDSIRKLDLFEGEEYLRVEGSVLVGNSIKKAWLYEFIQDFVHCISSEPWCFEHFVVHEKESFLKLCNQTACVDSRNSLSKTQ